MRSLGVLFLLAVAVTAQERPKPLPEIQALLDAAPAAPPELAADILLKLVDSGRIPSKEQRLEIVEQAFPLAGQAKFPYMQSAAVDRAGHTDSSPGIRQSGLGKGLSTMGLRCRAVRAALNIDKAKALDLFRQILVGPFPPLSCDDALAPELSEYYLVLQEVASNAYTPKDMKEGRHFELIETAVRNVATPRQLTPVAKLLAEFPMPQDRKTELVGTYAAALKRMDADPRSFGAVTVELGNALAGLSKKLQLDEISTVPLADAFRAYMALLETIPDGSLHDAVLRTYISYLKSSPTDRESPPEWLIHVRRLFSITDATPDHLDRVRAEIRRSGSLTMSLYAELARLDAARAARGNRN